MSRLIEFLGSGVAVLSDQVVGKEVIHIEGIDWDSDVDDEFVSELMTIKLMVEAMEKRMKAILVVDVPVLDDGRHLCNECPIWNKERLFCEYDFNMEAKGCPLKPIPQWIINNGAVFTKDGAIADENEIFEWYKELQK